jgi:serine/threonine protein kinase
MTYPSALKAGVQLLERLKDFHELGYIHRDLKPENICVGYDTNSAAVYLIDFGLSKMYLDSKGNHIQIKEKTVGLV